jgi:hypothetical protein
MTIGSVETEPVRISALEFDVLWEHYGLDQMPLVLKVPSPGRTDDERKGIVRRVWDGLAQRGLGSPVGLDPTLERLLLLLRRADREIDGRLWLGTDGTDGGGGADVRLFTAATGEDAVLATLAGQTLTLRGADATGLPRFALSVLPPMQAGPGQSITLPSADFEAAAAAATKQEELATELRDRGVRAADATALAEMIGDIVHRGQYGCAMRDRWGRRVRARRVISFFDTAGGRYLQVRREDDGAEPWTTISPADGRRMLQQLSALHEEQLVS